MAEDERPVVDYRVDGPVARLTLDRPERGNGLTAALISALAACVERADLDPAVRVLLLSGRGKGFCGGYDLVASAEGGFQEQFGADVPVAGTVLDPAVQRANHDPSSTWDPMVDYAMMSRNVRAFMALFHCTKPVVCKVHGFCVAGGTDLALCSDLLVIERDAKIGYPPARVWGSPTTSMWAHRLGPQRAKRLLFTGDCLSGAEALEWGLAIEAPVASELDERTEALVSRIAAMPVNQLQMMKLLVNQQTAGEGLAATQVLGTVFDGVARHTAEGYAFQRRAAEAGFKQAVHDRDDPFGDFGGESSGVIRERVPAGSSGHDRGGWAFHGSEPRSDLGGLRSAHDGRPISEICPRRGRCPRRRSTRLRVGPGGVTGSALPARRWTRAEAQGHGSGGHHDPRSPRRAGAGQLRLRDCSGRDRRQVRSEHDHPTQALPRWVPRDQQRHPQVLSRAQSRTERGQWGRSSPVPCRACWCWCRGKKPWMASACCLSR